MKIVYMEEPMKISTIIRTVTVFLLTATFVLMSGCASTDQYADAREDGKPIVYTMTPTGGIVGTTVTLVGEQFLDEAGESGAIKVYCADDGAAVNAAIESWSDNQIVFRIPSPENLNAYYYVEIYNNNNLKCPDDGQIYITDGVQTVE